MSPEAGELLIAWAARLAVMAWVIQMLTGLVRSPSGPGNDSRHIEPARLWIWTLGCACYLLHVAAAFQFAHHWSHAAALDHTARQTYEVTGWDWGGGLWINYAFTLWWPLDVVLSWWRGLDILPGWYRGLRDAVFAFLMINATVVFGSAGWRWAALVIFLAAVVLLMARPRHPADNSHGPAGADC